MANDAMIESLATIVSDFAGDANHIRCLAHIVNLVVKIIICQFDMSRKKKKEDKPNSDNDNGEELEEATEKLDLEIDEEVEELVRVLDKEEKEMDNTPEEADDEENKKLVRDVEIIEEAMEEEVKKVLKMAKPVCQVLYKVGMPFFTWGR